MKDYPEEVIMKCNVGGTDRTIRIVLGILLVIAGLFAQLEMTWRIVVLVVGAIALVTAFVRFCPINAMLGLDTSEKKEEEKK